MKNLLIVILLLFQVSCASNDKVESATMYESVRVYKWPMAFHSRYLIDEKSIKEGGDLLEKQVISDLDSLIIFNKLVNSLIPLDFNYKYFDVRALCEISIGNGRNNTLVINDVGDIKYQDRYYNKSEALFRFLQIQD